MLKHYFPMACLLLLLLAGCGKSHLELTGLTGSWKLLTVAGGGIVYVPLPPAKPQLLQLQADGSYIKKTDGVLSESGVYSLIIKYRTLNTKDTIISFKTGKDTSQRILRLSNEHLYIHEPRFDGVDLDYIRE